MGSRETLGRAPQFETPGLYEPYTSHTELICTESLLPLLDLDGVPSCRRGIWFCQWAPAVSMAQGGRAGELALHGIHLN